MEMVNRFNRIWQHKWGRRAIILLGIVALLSAPVRCGGPYKGLVIDEMSGSPIEGAVVVGYWSYSVPTPAGGSTRCLDAAEALTDEKGRFKIPGRWSPLGTAFIGETHIAIYKVGYQRVQCMWEVIDEAGSCYADKPVVFDGDRAVFPLNKVAKDKLKWEGSPPHISCGRKDKKSLSAWRNERKKYYDTISKKH